ncbi:hypothetical protein HDU91_004509 [Kappamyces sp. JEL0680]|nr:hypothetical protein HDU91_004509 [Kappamyces sp. JEL0680]
MPSINERNNSGRATIGRRTSSAAYKNNTPAPIRDFPDQNDIFQDDLSPLNANDRRGPSRAQTAGGRLDASALRTTPRSPFDRRGSPFDDGYADTMRVPVRRNTESSLPSLSRGQSDSRSESSNIPEDIIRVKAYFNGCRLVNIPFDANYDELLDAVRAKFRNPNIMLKFEDESGRKAIMSNDDDLAEALDLSPDPQKLEVWYDARS